MDTRTFFTAVNRPVDADVENLILHNACFATTGVASDGWIILTEGIRLERFMGNAVVTRAHVNDARPDQERPLVIANADALRDEGGALLGDVRFAQTAWDWAYLYGCNPDHRAFLRGWSIEGPIVAKQTVTWEQARKLSGAYWDEALTNRLRTRQRTVEVATEFELTAIAAVTLGADRNALTRAMGEGVTAAGEVLARMDLDAAGTGLDALKTKLSETDGKIARLEKEIQALRGEGASAAARGDSEAVLNEVREILGLFRGR